MRQPSQRRALGALFALLAAGFGGIAYAAAQAGQWAIVGGAAAIGLWLATISLRALR